MTTNANKIQTVTCPKCHGEGKILAFMHVDGGRCFMCAGAKTIEIDPNRKAPTPRPRDPAQRRQQFVNTFAGALRMIREEGRAWLSEADADDPRNGRTERDRIAAWLDSPDCPSDIRVRAVDAFARIGVSF